MSISFGRVKPGTVLPVLFTTYSSNDPAASVICSDFIAGDIEIHKDGGTTPRASTNGYSLIDTDGININSVTGLHGFTIDLADNSTADFYTAGSQYTVMVGPITVDAGSIVAIVATFEIGYEGAIMETTIATLASQTSFTINNAPTDDSALIGCTCIVHDIASKTQYAIGVVSNYTTAANTITLAADPGIFTMAAGDNISFFMPTDVHTWLGTVAATPTVAGVPEVDVTHQGGGAVPAPAVTGVPDVNLTHHVDVAASVTNSELDVNVGQIIGTAPSLTGGEIDVNVASEDNIDFGATKKASINTEVDSAFTTQVADSVPADGTRPTREQALYMAIQALTEFAISSTTITVKKVDGSTTLMTYTLDSATSPTSRTRAS